MVWIWKLSVLVTWCKLVKTFRSERSPANWLFTQLAVQIRLQYHLIRTADRSTRVLNFWYSYCTHTRELQSNSTRICTHTHGQVLRYSYEYWHEYWYSMVHVMICDVRVKKHHTCQINSLTYFSSQSQVKDFYYNKIIIIHRMTQRLKPIWIYLSHKFLPLYTLQRPHFGDNSVSTGASTEAVQPKKLRHNRHKLHWNRSTDSSATSDGKTDTTVAVPLQWTTMMPNIEV